MPISLQSRAPEMIMICTHCIVHHVGPQGNNHQATHRNTRICLPQRVLVQGVEDLVAGCTLSTSTVEELLARNTRFDSRISLVTRVHRAALTYGFLAPIPVPINVKIVHRRIRISCCQVYSYSSMYNLSIHQDWDGKCMYCNNQPIIVITLACSHEGLVSVMLAVPVICISSRLGRQWEERDHKSRPDDQTNVEHREVE